MKRRMLETTQSGFQYIWEKKSPDAFWSIIYHAVPGKEWIPYKGHEFANVDQSLLDAQKENGARFRDIEDDDELFIELL